MVEIDQTSDIPSFSVIHIRGDFPKMTDCVLHILLVPSANLLTWKPRVTIVDFWKYDQFVYEFSKGIVF